MILKKTKLSLTFDILEGYITVISPIPGTPSDRAGLQSGDKIVKINGKSQTEIDSIIIKKIRKIKNVTTTTTLSVIPEQEKN